MLHFRSQERILTTGAFAITLITFVYFDPLSGLKTSNGITDSGAETSSIPVSPKEGFKTGLTRYPLLTWETSKIVEDTIKVHISMEYPHFLGGISVTKLNEYIETYLQNIIEKDRNKLETVRRDDQSTVRDYADSYNVSVTLESIYRLIGVTNGIVSMEIIVTDFTEGGNGNHDEPVTINWDLKSNRLLTVDELFCSKNYRELLTPLVRTQLIKLLGTDLRVTSGTIPEGGNWQYFLIKNDGILVVFPPYQVSSGSQGVVKAFIPNSAIPNLLCLP
ncbi:MAG: RsiV family protein [Patescibacteria group bacterium]